MIQMMQFFILLFCYQVAFFSKKNLQKIITIKKFEKWKCQKIVERNVLNNKLK